MPPAYIVQADVIDIRVDAPQKQDVFVVDTNVWFWATYTKATPAPHQRTHYPRYLKSALTAGSSLLHFVLGQSELFHLIEKAERELFSPGIPPKDFRHNHPMERSKVVAECNLAWNSVKGMTSPLAAMVSDAVADAALVRFQTQPLDGYDLYLLEAMLVAGHQQVLTDDGDFSAVPGIRLFTANQNVISAARSQGKLLTR